MPSATTIGGWAVVAGVATYYYFMFGQRKSKNIRQAETKPYTKVADTAKKTKKEKAQRDGGLSSGDQSAQSASKSSKKKKKTASKPQSAAVNTASEPHQQSNVETVDDADDDQSPVNSPALAATKAVEPIARGNVSDMLEKMEVAPAVLKVTAPTKSSEPKKQTSQAAPDSAETKKQRQNRKKAEEKKAAREADEKERRTLMEKQRRTAREAEGRAAKDGSTFMAAQAPAKSAWTAPPAVNGEDITTGNGAAPKPVELLDTYEPKGKVTTVPADAVRTENGAQGARLAKEYAGLTEDEQLRLVQQDSAAWETVKGREKRKNKAHGKDTKDSKDGKPSSSSERSDLAVAQPVQPTVTAAKVDTPVTQAAGNPYTIERSLEAEDAEWDVS